jgi:hypothetical protein
MPDITITALFDDRSDAEAGIDRLIALGLPAENLHLTVAEADEEDDTDPRPIMDRIAGFLFPDEDRDILARGLEEGAIMVTATAVPQEMEALAVQALDDAGAVEIDESDTGPHEDSLRDVAGAVTSAPRSEGRRPDDPQPDASDQLRAGSAALGDVDSGTSGMAGMDIPHAGVTADRAMRRRRGSSRRVRSYWVDEAGEVENVAIERDNLPS